MNITHIHTCTPTLGDDEKKGSRSRAGGGGEEMKRATEV